jgi:uncharacterized protein (TIGR03437 family)
VLYDSGDNYMKRLIFLTVLGSSWLAAQPTIYTGGIVNADSLVPAGLPNANIAQGSIFSVFGTNLGPAQSPGLSFPLQTTLGGVSVQVTSGGTMVNAIPLFVGPGQINALLPSVTPTGPVSLTVSNSGGTSAPATFHVVDHSFGINSVNQSGSGPGIVDNSSYKLITQNSAAQAGDVIIIWGTGLGAVTGQEEDGPLPGNLPSIRAKVYVGAEQAKINYQGRSGCCAGVDQIAVVVPAGVTGCHVPVAVEIDGAHDIVSNWVTTSIAAPGAQRICSDATGPSSGDLLNFLSKGGSFGFVGLERRISTSPALPPPYGTGAPTTTTTDSGSADFEKYTPEQFTIAENIFQTYTIGACVVFVFNGQSAIFTDPTTPVGLDAGKLINVNGTNGAKQLLPTSSIPGSYSATLGGGSGPTVLPLYLAQGAYAIDNGAGGADVKSFNFSLTVPPPLDWTNMNSVGPIIRANGQLVTWTGGDPNGIVSITGDSIQLGSDPNGSTAVGAFFTCTAPVSAGKFTIPAPVLLSLPPSTVITPIPGVSIDAGSLSVGTSSLPVKFTAEGLDYGFAGTSVTSSKTLGYQ